MDFQVLGPIRDIETIAAGRALRQLRRLRRRYGGGQWRKRKGEAHGVGRREFKIKFPLLD